MKSSPVTTVAGAVALCALLVLGHSCQGRTTPAADSAGSEEQPTDLASAPLPELATIGGAQDVWPFEFGLDAKRIDVEAAIGTPESISERAAGTESSPGRVVSWTFPTVEFRFFVSSDGAEEFMLAATITSAEVPLRGGLSVGMSIEDAVAVLGKPDVENESLLVYFYFNSTIELYKSDGMVEAVMLARALP
jgi:hypothetical protein